MTKRTLAFTMSDLFTLEDVTLYRMTLDVTL